jgi:hypothetical protein
MIRGVRLGAARDCRESRDNTFSVLSFAFHISGLDRSRSLSLSWPNLGAYVLILQLSVLNAVISGRGRHHTCLRKRRVQVGLKKQATILSKQGKRGESLG